jgi:hypothetical protein
MCPAFFSSSLFEMGRSGSPNCIRPARTQSGAHPPDRGEVIAQTQTPDPIKVFRGFLDRVDELFIAMLCDPGYRATQKGRGDDPERLTETYADMINAAISDIPADMKIMMHLCRGSGVGTQ